jgi:hypothetical protein
VAQGEGPEFKPQYHKKKKKKKENEVKKVKFQIEWSTNTRAVSTLMYRWSKNKRTGASLN